MRFAREVTGLSLYAWDIDSDPSATTMTDLWGWATPTPDDIEIGSQVQLAGSIPGYTTYGTTNPGENVLDFPAIPWIPEDQLPHTVANSYVTFEKGNFVWGFQGSENFTVTRGHQILGVIPPEPGSAMTAFLTGAAMVGLVNRRKRQS